MMDSQQIAYFRSELERQRDEVLAELADHRMPTDRINDLEEKADRAASNLVENRIKEDDGNLLQKIEYALKRLEVGSYQQCDHCGNEINIERLKAKPSVSLCVNCQELKDSGRLPPN